MPQMMPMKWTLLFISFTINFMTICMINYYLLNNKMSLSIINKTSLNNKHLNWKW